MTAPNTGRFVGNTTACFTDFINTYPGLMAHQLLAEFCGDDVTVKIVHNWQRGDYFALGMHLLKLRCFLALAGYDVEELARLNGDYRLLGYAICFGIFDAAETEDRLGYKGSGLKSLWRLVLHGGDPIAGVKQKATDLLVPAVKSQIRERQNRWRSRIGQWLEAQALTQPATTPVPATLSVDPALAVAFARLVAATTALGSSMLTGVGLKQAVLDATRAGLDLTELIDVLQQLLPREG